MFINHKSTAILAIGAVIMTTSCMSHKGSSSLDSVTKTTTVTKRGTPTVRADQKASSNADKRAEESRVAHEKAIEEAKASAQAAADEAQRKLAEAKKVKEEAEAAAAEAKANAEAEAKAKAEAEAQKLKEQAEAEAQKLKEQAEQKAQELAAKVAVREEAATLVETKSQSSGLYHIIVGSFKSLDNAHALCDKAISQGYLPSIMENPDGMYRVSVFSADDEKVARKQIVEILKANPEYTGSWLLKIK